MSAFNDRMRALANKMDELYHETLALARIPPLEIGEPVAWISVKDRPSPSRADPLAMLDTRYLVCLETAVMPGLPLPNRYVAVGWTDGKGRWYADGWRDNPMPDGSPRYTVTHWAPLPEPPSSEPQSDHQDECHCTPDPWAIDDAAKAEALKQRLAKVFGQMNDLIGSQSRHIGDLQDKITELKKEGE
jgi:hypothetical protein